jgi:hypothetical protein
MDELPCAFGRSNLEDETAHFDLISGPELADFPFFELVIHCVSPLSFSESCSPAAAIRPQRHLQKILSVLIASVQM